MNQHRLLVLSGENQSYRSLLQSAALPGLELLPDLPDDQVLPSDTYAMQGAVPPADIWLAEPAPAAALLRAGAKPAWLQCCFAGVDKLMTADLPHDYRLTNIRGIFGPLMREYVFAFLLAQLRRVDEYRRQQQAGLWRELPAASLRGRTMLILGTGSIGAHLAASARHFGMHAQGVSLSGRAVAEFDQVYPVGQLDSLLPGADVVVSVLPATPATSQLLDARRLALLRPAAVLFNLGRGNVLDYAALLTQLRRNPRQQAILDVFPEEPLPPDSPLWSCPNLTITPHVSAPSIPQQIVDIFAANYRRYLAGQPLDGEVDFSKGY
ncbi:MAG: D-2-hydroxyacid dehydrogenase [Spirochaetes bacterium]|nr:D-2-hydroxyacid dehydrogenase [Spirochaetota bacterium]MBU0956327.1 D-2-hydroxyacid dehydrogenase [Spirochaetota bacterium]